ncbi:F-box only protein 4 [Denticeps clupeoides]|uniref:F-box domain-containing protein n=1 Tax=Denticeps clupeoides TaxID=299321 RepID=A0AAY4AUN4_9TELE|nr:F-box only protein 4 [Denticeps clupeoides]
MNNESIVIRSFRNIKEKLFGNGKRSDVQNGENAQLEQECFLDLLPVDKQFLIMTFLSPQDLCLLGGTSRYWRALVRDPLLWRYFLLRDMPLWQSIDHVSMPKQLEALENPLTEGSDLQKHDFMGEYLKACPDCRSQWQQSKPTYEAVASFLKSLVVPNEPRFAMFGPGLEQLEVSLITNMMCMPHILRVEGTHQRQISGIGSGITFMFNQSRFNILVLYSTNRTERERARVEHAHVNSKLFIREEDQQQGKVLFRLLPHVQEVCQLVDGFIYVTNAETDRGFDGAEEARAQIRAMLQPDWGPTSRPLLVLSCVSNVWLSSQHTPCTSTAHQLELSLLPNPWMVQNTAAQTLSGLMDGFTWILRHAGQRN